MAAKMNYAHNKKVLDSLNIGDRVEFKRGIYSHWGIYLGGGKIIHLAGEENDGIDGRFNSTHFFSIGGRSFNKAFVKIEDFWKVVGEDKAYKNNSYDRKKSPLDPETIVRNAMSKIGEVGYNVIYSNCEHFVNWCRYREKRSEQVDNAITGLAVAGATFLATGVVYAFSKFGKSESESNKEKRQHY